MSTPTVSPHHHHAVQFYSDDNSLCVTVARFLGAGLVAGQPAIIIATPSHTAAIEEHLAGRMIDCGRARREGELLVLDAEETLSLFMIDGQPNEELFEVNIGRLIEQTLRGRTRTTVRAYGEMVDVLWKQGESQAAINLEMLWNKLATKYDFALHCGYAMGSFYKQTQDLEAIGALHSRVIEPNVIPFRKTKRRRLARELGS